MYGKSVKESLCRFKNSMKSISKVVIGRESIINQLAFALLTGHHLLLEGSPGVAKSFFAMKVFNSITGARTFKIQCTRKMTEDSIVGPPNVKVLRDEGRFEHNVEGTLVTSHFGFLDEIMDLSSGALRALLEILNERTFSRGRQRETSPLISAIATTNFNRDDEEELGAVLDRFLFRAKVEPLNGVAQRKKMILAEDIDIPTFSLSDLRTLQRAVAKVVVPDRVLDCYLETVASLNITDRRCKQAVDVIKASAVMHGRSKARISDIGALHAVFAIPGDRASEQAWGTNLSSYSKYLQEEECKSKAILVISRMVQLRTAAAMCCSYSEIKDIALEAADATNALVHLNNSETVDIVNRGLKISENILSRADNLFSDSKKAKED